MAEPRKFKDRMEAGRRLAEELGAYAGLDDVLVLGLPRGGVPVAFEVARELDAPLDVFVVRKLGVPGHEELAMGAVASGGIRFVDEALTSELGISEDVVARTAAEEQEELQRRERAYRGTRAEAKVAGRVVIVVDDGLATGSSMQAALLALRAQDPERLVVAVPVGASAVCDAFRDTDTEVVCPLTPDPLRSVGLWYDDFSPTSDEEVRELLDRAERELPGRPEQA